MATLQLNKENQFTQNRSATLGTCTFLVNGAVSDVEVHQLSPLRLIGRVQNVAPGNTAKINGLTPGTEYRYSMNPKRDPKLANSTVTY